MTIHTISLPRDQDHRVRLHGAAEVRRCLQWAELLLGLHRHLRLHRAEDSQLHMLRHRSLQLHCLIW